MLFQSATFLWGFLFPVLAIFYVASRWGGVRWAVGVLVVASLIFYGWSRPWHLAILLSSIAINYFLADRIIAWRGTPRGRLFLIAGVAGNLGLLAWFKYALFVSASVQALTGWSLGWHAVVLPLGISFFTFQKIAYLVDAWRGQFTAQRWSDYALFVTFFPQLIAGPIVHRTEFFPQIHGREFGRWRTERIAGGAAIFVLGLGKKLLLADPLGRDADLAFAQFSAGSPVGVVDAWLGVLAYGFQIYFDFSAYSDMAIGLALLFGLTLPENFAAPYRATSMIEFWRRWHMTLSRFLRDYLYIPLGGNTGGRLRQARSLFVTMLLGGLWHGAAWTFVAWGAWHGVGLAINHWWRAGGRRLPGPVGWLLTFISVSVAWVFFRADNFATVGHALQALGGRNGFWAAGAADGWAWLRASRLVVEYQEFHDLFHFLEWNGQIFGSGVEWRQLLFSRAGAQAGRVVLALAIVLLATPSVRWLWDLPAGRSRFSSWKAIVVGSVLLAVILQGIAVSPSTFIYFRF